MSLPKFPWIENYVGIWRNKEGRTLIISTVDDETATADLLVDGAPMPRPWCGNQAAQDLTARLRPNGEPGLEIELGRPGFSFDVNYEFYDPATLDDLEFLSVGVSCYESDTEARRFSSLLGRLGKYRRADPAGTGD